MYSHFTAVFLSAIWVFYCPLNPSNFSWYAFWGIYITGFVAINFLQKPSKPLKA